MAQVSLIVTGRLEQLALAQSLAQIFPLDDFVARPRVDGITSSVMPVRPIASNGRVSYVDEFAAKLVGEAFPGRDKSGPAPDLVVAVDDLELVNSAQPAVVTRTLAQAVDDHIEAQFPSAATRKRARDTVRTRCSFHLFAPMMEAYFFAEPAALDRAGRMRVSQFAPTTDVEHFAVNDPVYQQPPDTKPKHDWRKPDRARHPKRYLKFLTDDALDGFGTYSETGAGVAALSTLDWRTVMAAPSHAKFARSLLEDLADGLNRTQPYPGLVESTTWTPGRLGVLRNI